MPKWAKTPLMVNRIPSALSCCRVHEPGDGSEEGVCGSVCLLEDLISISIQTDSPVCFVVFLCHRLRSSHSDIQKTFIHQSVITAVFLI